MLLRNVLGLLRWTRFRVRHPRLRTGLFFLDRRATIYVGPRGDLVVGKGTVFLQDLTARLEAPVRIGSRVFFNRGCHVVVKAGLAIGDNTLIGEYVSIHDEAHTIVDGAIEGPNAFRASPIAIGCKVWIGAKATVLPGVTIGDRCIVGAGAVVTKDLPDGSVAVGVPARVVRTLDAPGTPGP